ncbi:hypothetical protein [Planctomycetes bacterium K23_9]|uniref:Glycoside hydrolase family 38 N-terminal domain-containing protein n=1 Tax=Stieleria marina TaxID=1930275 RepID=A0A517NW16_9BACT|nr:hypothetical protein K239x_32800 [Planctomycetes bacterium K23_9]
MAPFDESSVLIPVATLEDFPADASDSDARSLLAGWTVLWHPQLIAATEQLPTWFRADAPPEPDGPRIVVVPDSSFLQLPSAFEQKCKNNKDCQWITGSDRAAMLAQLGLPTEMPTLQTDHRTIGVDDFFAAAYASLQIQIMTRRLRYTSNLDEIYLQKEVVKAAQAFIAGNASEAATAFHNVFDCLSEERDHYFSSDPHLIDLTLLTPATLENLVQSDALSAELSRDPQQADLSCLPTPGNVLIDVPVAQAIQNDSEGRFADFATLVREGHVGWIGGSPDDGVCFDAMSFDDAAAAVQASHDFMQRVIGKSPTVYGRFTGSTPADMTPTLVRLGYEGIVPIDFARGSGFGEEAKVLQQSGGVEIESLTAKPIDASSDSGFLNIGARLGEAIDSGEIATGLFAHWPGQSCDSFRDLRRVASWCVALGRFWKLQDYFTEGEHPYHHATARSVSSDAHELLTQRVADGSDDPISQTAASTRHSVASESGGLLIGMRSLIQGEPCDPVERRDAHANDLAGQVAIASGAKLAGSGSDARMIINPLSVSQRVAVTLAKSVDESPEHIFAVDSESGKSHVSVDVVAGGFTVVQGSASTASKQPFFKRWMAPKGIADGEILRNEFMEVAISSETGGIAGVYSGGTRGNRFSMRLVWTDALSKAAQDGSTMKCNRVSVAHSSPSVGRINATGIVLDRDSNEVATFDLNYELRRGSRFVHVSGNVTPKGELTDAPWDSYLAARVAVASESAIGRVIVRDKLHRARGRRLVAPLGVVLDESERQTLIASHGNAFHRRIGDRFVDTLLSVKGETAHDIRLSYGFDCPNPVGHAKALISPPTVVDIAANAQLPPRGWITHVTPSSAMISEMQVHRRDDGRLAATVRIIQTRSQSATGTVRFCRDVAFANKLTTGDTDEINQKIPLENASPDDDANDVVARGLKCKGDAVTVPIASHQVIDLLVVFAK